MPQCKYFDFSPIITDLTTANLSKPMSLNHLYYYLEKLCCEFLSISSPLLFIVEALYRNSPFFLPLTHTPFLINFSHYLVNLLLSRKPLSAIANYKDQFSLSSYQTQAHILRWAYIVLQPVKCFIAARSKGHISNSDSQAVSQDP